MPWIFPTSLFTMVPNSWRTITFLQLLYPETIKASRNTEFTERAVNDTDVSQDVRIGNYEETGPISETAVTDEVYQEPYRSANMETYDINRALNREYPLTTISWDTSQISGTKLGNNSFPESLFNKSFIADKIKDFRLFRGGVRLTVRITSNKFLYGKIMVTYEPSPQTNAYTADAATLHSGSGFPHIIVSASASEAAVFDVPFISKKRFLDLNDFLNNEIGIFRYLVLNPLTDVNGGAADTAQIFITAQFIDAELMLPRSTEDTAAAKATVGKIAQNIFETQSKVTKVKNPEGEKKSAQGTISSTLEVLAPLAGLVGTMPLAAPYADTFSVLASTGASVAKMYGLSKPTTEAMTQVGKINPFSDIASGKGIDTGIKLAMDPENQISTKPIVGGISADEMELRHIAGTPMLTRVISYLPNSSSAQIATTSPFDDNMCFVDFLSRNFAYISGSYKYKVYITASNFHTVRGVFWLSDTSANSDWADCYHKVVDIQGDTEVDFTIPYCGAPISEPTQNTDVFSVYFKIITWSQPDAAISAPIALNVYKAAGSDFRFGGLKEKVFTVQSNPRADFAAVFEPFEPSMTGYVHDGLLYGEEYKTLREVVHRYCAVKQTATDTSVPAYDGRGNFAANKFCGLQLFGLMFRFFRGSTRFKIVNKTPTKLMSCYLSDSDQSATYYGTGITSSTNPLLEIEAPYYTNNAFLDTTPYSNDGRVVNFAATDSFLFTAAGDDFSFHFLRGPPVGTFESTLPAGSGVAGFQTYVNS